MRRNISTEKKDQDRTTDHEGNSAGERKALRKDLNRFLMTVVRQEQVAIKKQQSSESKIEVLEVKNIKANITPTYVMARQRRRVKKIP